MGTSSVSLQIEPIQAVKQWLLAKHESLSDIEMDMDLIENRVLSSLEFMNFVFFLEELIERELDLEAGSVEAFRTLRNIQEQIINGSE